MQPQSVDDDDDAPELYKPQLSGEELLRLDPLTEAQKNPLLMKIQSNNLTDIVWALKCTQKSQTDIDLIIRASSSFAFFSQFQHECSTNKLLHSQASECFSYLFMSKGSVFLRAEQIPERFFMLVSGSIGAFDPSISLTTLVKKPQSELNHEYSKAITGFPVPAQLPPSSHPTQIYPTGSHFGDTSILYSKALRNNLICQEDCHFAVLDKHKFTSIFKTKLDKMLHSRVEQLKKYPCFSGWSTGILRNMCLNSVVCQFNQGDYVFKEGEPSDSIGIVAAGMFSLHKKFEISKGQLKQARTSTPTEVKNVLQTTLSNQKNHVFNVNDLTSKKRYRDLKILEISEREPFGEQDVLENKAKRGYSVRCQSLKGEVLFIDALFFRDDLLNFPAISANFLSQIVGKQSLILSRIQALEATIGIGELKSYLYEFKHTPRAQSVNAIDAPATTATSTKKKQEKSYIAQFSSEQKSNLHEEDDSEEPTHYYYDGVPDETFPLGERTTFYGMKIPEKLVNYKVIKEIRPPAAAGAAGESTSNGLSPIKVSFNVDEEYIPVNKFEIDLDAENAQLNQSHTKIGDMYKKKNYMVDKKGNFLPLMPIPGFQSANSRSSGSPPKTRNEYLQQRNRFLQQAFIGSVKRRVKRIDTADMTSVSQVVAYARLRQNPREGMQQRVCQSAVKQSRYSFEIENGNTDQQQKSPLESVVLSRVMEHPRSYQAGDIEMKEIIDYYLTQNSLSIGTPAAAQDRLQSISRTTRTTSVSNSRSQQANSSTPTTRSSRLWSRNREIQDGTLEVDFESERLSTHVKILQQFKHEKKRGEQIEKDSDQASINEINRTTPVVEVSPYCPEYKQTYLRRAGASVIQSPQRQSPIRLQRRSLQIMEMPRLMGSGEKRAGVVPPLSARK